MALCPACARGSHDQHQETPTVHYRFAAALPCRCPGDCASEPEHLRRLVAAGVIAPAPNRRD